MQVSHLELAYSTVIEEQPFIDTILASDLRKAYLPTRDELDDER